MRRRGKHQKTIETLEHRTALEEDLLKAVAVLAPGRPEECSANEVADRLGRSVRGTASRLGRLQKRGLVESRIYMQRHLWRITDNGRKYLKASK